MYQLDTEKASLKKTRKKTVFPPTRAGGGVAVGACKHNGHSYVKKLVARDKLVFWSSERTSGKDLSPSPSIM
jgi:hypothetical protein